MKRKVYEVIERDGSTNLYFEEEIPGILGTDKIYDTISYAGTLDTTKFEEWISQRAIESYSEAVSRVQAPVDIDA